MKPAILAAAAALALTACTDAKVAKITALGQAARVTCHSGGRVIFDDFSTGKVSNSESSDGYYFRAASTGRLAETSGECVLDYGATKPAGFKAVRP